MAEYHLLFKPSAEKGLRKLPENVQKRIVKAIEVLKSEPRSSGSAKMKGADNLWRIRVGDYRVVYTVQDEELIVLVVRIAHRKDVYRGL